MKNILNVNKISLKPIFMSLAILFALGIGFSHSSFEKSAGATHPISNNPNNPNYIFTNHYPITNSPFKEEEVPKYEPNNDNDKIGEENPHTIHYDANLLDRFNAFPFGVDIEEEEEAELPTQDNHVNYDYPLDAEEEVPEYEPNDDNGTSNGRNKLKIELSQSFEKSADASQVDAYSFEEKVPADELNNDNDKIEEEDLTDVVSYNGGNNNDSSGQGMDDIKPFSFNPNDSKKSIWDICCPCLKKTNDFNKKND